MLNEGTQPAVLIFDHRVDVVGIDIRVLEDLQYIRKPMFEVRIHDDGDQLEIEGFIKKCLVFLLFGTRSLKRKRYQEVGLIDRGAKSWFWRKISPNVFVAGQVVRL